MFGLTWPSWISRPSSGQRRKPSGGQRFRPALQGLEERVLLAGTDLAVIQKAIPIAVAPGTDLTYEITFSNDGPSDAVNAQLRETVPVNTTFVSATGPAGFIPATPAVGGTGTVTFQSPTFANASSAMFKIVVHVDPAAPNGSTIQGTAIVSSASLPDPNPANNIVTTMTAVQGSNALSSSGLLVHAVQGTSLSGVSVASVVDARGPQPPGSYKVLINWGDGTPASLGTVRLESGTLLAT